MIIKEVYLVKENSSYGLDAEIWPNAYSSYQLALESVSKYIDNKGYDNYKENSWCKEGEHSNHYIHIIKIPLL